MQAISAANNVIPLFGYCVRACGKPAVRREVLENGDVLCLCEDRPRCRPADQPLYKPAYCDPDNEVRGACYDRNLSVKEIAKLMRQAIKKELPGVKVSVRMDGYNCIRMALVAAPGVNCESLIPMQQWYEQNDLQGIRRPWKENYRPEMVELMAKLKNIHDRWNRDNSDISVDYFDVNYYGSVSGPDGLSW
jgi:hypothetical protein